MLNLKPVPHEDRLSGRTSVSGEQGSCGFDERICCNSIADVTPARVYAESDKFLDGEVIQRGYALL